MKKNYVVEMMNDEQFHKMMSGAMFYDVKENIVEAETPEEALEIAHKQYPDYNFNKNYVKTVEERDEKARKEKEEYEARKEKEAKAKEKAKNTREANLRRKAEEAGMTVEEYKKEENKKRVRTRLMHEIEALEKELNNKKRYLEKYYL